MIIKTFEIKKKKIDTQNFFLVYGENDGLKNEIVQTLKKLFNGNTDNYDEAQILNNKEFFYENLLNKSLFDKEKIIIVNRCSERIYDIVESIIEKKIYDTKIILIANILEKKSKLRNLFEKDKNLIIVPTYKDNSDTLLEMARKFF